MNRRTFLKTTAGTIASSTLTSCAGKKSKAPNVVFLLADQWRGQDVGYADNTQVYTPNIDKLATQSIILENAISGCPVCSPYRASLMTGQYPLTHGVFYNDKPLRPRGLTLAECFAGAGYDTAYIGKWHLKGHEKGVPLQTGRSAPVPKNRRFGFDFWKVHECTHDYNNSVYYDEQNDPHTWEGYDAIAQTTMAQNYIRDHANREPFLLFLSWGPPHAPYGTAPQEYRDLFDNYEDILLRPNVPDRFTEIARKSIAGYYAHIAALDACIGRLYNTLKECAIENNTIFIFTSDHGDMLYSHGQTKKQKPWEESIHVPFLLYYPPIGSRILHTPINTVDILPTMLSLCDIEIPNSIEGENISQVLRGENKSDRAVIIECPVPFHQWNYKRGGREYRGLRTKQYTYARDLSGPWLLCDNQRDEFQQNNLVENPNYADVLKELDRLLMYKLKERGDAFQPGAFYMAKWNYQWDGEDSEKESPKRF